MIHTSHFRKEPVSIKKLKKGDVSWATIKNVLGWIIDTTNMTISLPQHRVERLGAILASIPATQKRTTVKKWHKLLGELRSMSLALPGASRNLFSHMQNTLTNQTSKRINLNDGIHSALNDFRWMHKDISSRPTRIQELVPLPASALGFHDASGDGAGGVWFPSQSLHPRNPATEPHAPIVWRLEWPTDVKAALITEANPKGTITIADLELAGGLLHLDVLCTHFDVRERTILSKTDNLATLFWQRKGSATTENVPAHLLRLFGIHQRVHRYVPRHDYIAGKSNPMADDASCLFHLTNPQFLSHFHSTYPQKPSLRLVHPTSKIVSGVISALHKKMCPVECLEADLQEPTLIGKHRQTLPISWASIPYSKPSRTKYQSYKSSSEESVRDNCLPTDIPSSLDRLKITYGQLHRRSSHWVNQTPV